MSAIDLKSRTLRGVLACVLAGAAWMAVVRSVAAQMTITGRFSGTVVDTSGAAIPGVTVAVVNLGTGLTRTVTTDARGFYVVTDLPVGNYSLAAEQKSFGREIRTGYHIDPDARVTVDFTLKPGAVTETVEVTGTGETVNTTSGEISRVVDAQQVETLPLNGRNYGQLVTLMPGAAVTDEDEMAVTTGLTASPFSVNGIRSDQNLHTVDGGFNLDSGSNGSLINNVGLDFVQEVSVKTSNFSAEYGRSAGAAVNVVTKSGSNRLHGGISEYFRNDYLDAVNYFSRDQVSGAAIKPPLRFNNPTWQLGGPIKRDKLFFYVGEQWKYLRSSTAPVKVTMPTTAELSGDFRDWKYNTLKLTKPASAPAGCTITNNVLSPQCITADGAAIAKLYGAMEQQAASFTNTGTGSNTIYQNAQPFDSREDFARVDLSLTQKHNIYLRYIHDEFSILLPSGFSCATDVPSCPEDRRRPGTSYQVAHTWTITPTLVNEAKINASWNGQRLNPVGDSWKRSTYGFVFPQLFPNGGGRFRNSIPDIMMSTFQTLKGQSHALLSPTTDIAPGDNLTWSHGAHTLKTGVLVIRNRKDQNARSLYAGAITFTGTGSNSSGNSLADALMGNFNKYEEASDDPVGHFRFTQYHAYVTDNWKVLRNLSLEVGVRYQYFVPWYTQANNLTNFDPALYDPSQAVTLKLDGTIDTTKGGNPFNGLIRAGSGGAPSAIPDGATRGLYQGQSTWAPRFGFALQPFNDNKTSVRGGIGLFYDTPEGNMIFDEVGNPPFSSSAVFNTASLSNPAGGAAPKAGGLSISAIDPNLKQAYSMTYSLSVQRELPSDVFLEVAYVGNQARHLMRKPDINMPSIATMLANQTLPSTQKATALDALRAYKGYSTINMFLSDAISNYNALQIYATKRKGDLTLTGSYTWSKNLTDSGGGNEDVRNSGASDNIEDATMRFLNYGPALFDHRHIFVTTFNYRLPSFRSESGFLGETLGGWELGGLTQLQTGGPFTVTGNSTFAGLTLPSSSRRRADYLGGPVQIDGPNATQWFNSAAFAPAPDGRLGNSGAGLVRGPGLYKWDFSLRKEFGLGREDLKLQFRADVVNAFNHTNFRFSSQTSELVNNTNISSGDYGHPTTAGPPRQIQLGMRLTF
ncbi:MAG: TonB-dependent receptor [Acidobacteria bacterium]|nr:MAG: TonB-dependent receptor [Acidobacteriota bacterium]